MDFLGSYYSDVGEEDGLGKRSESCNSFGRPRNPANHAIKPGSPQGRISQPYLHSSSTTADLETQRSRSLCYGRSASCQSYSVELDVVADLETIPSATLGAELNEPAHVEVTEQIHGPGDLQRRNMFSSHTARRRTTGSLSTPKLDRGFLASDQTETPVATGVNESHGKIRDSRRRPREPEEVLEADRSKCSGQDQNKRPERSKGLRKKLGWSIL